MKKITVAALVAIMLVGALSSAFAQGAGPKNGGQGVGQGQKQGQQGQRGRMGRKMQEEIYAKLGLNEKQKAQIKSINEKYMKQFEAIRGPQGAGQRTPPSEENRKKMMDLFQKRNAELMAVLTPAQKTKYEALMKEMRDKMQKGGGRPGGAPPPGGGKPPKGGSTGGSF
jgi:Spy/CpxP family protein refolding chaperone